MSTELSWLLTLTDEQRTLFRDRGRILATRLLEYLDARDPDAVAYHLEKAAASATEQGKAAAALGLSLSQTVEAFLRFRAPFLHELGIAGRRRGFDATETRELLETAERGMDRLLVATMTGHGGATPHSRGGQRAASPSAIAHRASR